MGRISGHFLCPLEMLIGHLQIMLGRDRFAVADPGANDVNRIRLGQFGFAGAAEILERLSQGATQRYLSWMDVDDRAE